MQLTLSGTIRDFKDSHPDFEYKIASEKNIVAKVLGPNRKPVYRGGSGVTTNGKEFFDQWYNDIEGVNWSKRFDITLEDQDNNGIFTYENNQFFPIDDELFGNQERPHNYHFTYEIHSEFTYQGNEVFTFKGDDDLWVFIDGKLVIDIGGVHDVMTDTVDLTVPAGEKTLVRKLTPDLTLTLEVGKTYAFDLFFAERHTTQSNFRIDTSLVLKPLPLVTIQATDSQAQEHPSNRGEFTISLDKPAEKDVAVSFTVSGSATEGDDYQALPRKVVIPAGETEVKIPLIPVKDEAIEGAETVTLTLQPSDYHELGQEQMATVFIGDYVPPKPVVTIKATDPKATEPLTMNCPPDSGTFTVCLDQPAPTDLKIAYKVKGTATLGQDYKPFGRAVTIPKGQTQATLVVTPKADDELCEGDETVIVTLKAGDNYELGNPNSDQVVIKERQLEMSDRNVKRILFICLWLVLLFICLIVFNLDLH